MILFLLDSFCRFFLFLVFYLFLVLVEKVSLAGKLTVLSLSPNALLLQECKPFSTMEEVFPISGFNTPSDESSDPFDTTSTHSDPFDLDEHDREERIAASDTKRLRELVAKFARGFDAGSFPDYVHAWIPKLEYYLFPGSYAHLMLILLEEWDQMEYFQLSMFQWLCQRYPVPHDYRIGGTRGVDDRLFVSELEVLKKLLSPLCGDNSRPIYWIGSRLTNPDDSCNQVKTSMRIIKNFKDEISAEIRGPNDDSKLPLRIFKETGLTLTGTIYSLWGNSEDRRAEISVREFRMDACRASLGWGEFLKSDIHFTSFHQHYKAHLIATSPERARAIGFLPPLHPSIPKYAPVHPDTEKTAWCEWQHPDLSGSILDLVLKTAVWLGLARGSAAVHLFCDVVRAFSLKKPTKVTHSDRIALLYQFTALRVSCEGIESGLATPYSHEDQSLTNENSEYSTNNLGTTYYTENRTGTSSASHFTSRTFFDPATPNSQELPLIHRRSRLNHGKIKLYYHVREVLDSLSQASAEMTLSSKMVPEKHMFSSLAPGYASTIVAEDEYGDGKVPSLIMRGSRPVSVAGRRRASSMRAGYY